jgi:hypothetical protein
LAAGFRSYKSPKPRACGSAQGSAHSPAYASTYASTGGPAGISSASAASAPEKEVNDVGHRQLRNYTALQFMPLSGKTVTTAFVV